jgi:hypothetical protein
MPHIFKPQVDSLDAVPAPFQQHYKKTEAGNFAMDPEVFELVNPTGFQTALDKERAAAKAAAKALEPWRGLGEDPNAIAAELNRLKEEVAKKDSTSGQFEKYKQEVAALHATQLAEKDKSVSAMQQSLESYLIEAEAGRILAEAKGSAALLMPHIKSSVKVFNEGGKYVVRVVDSEGDPRISAQTGTAMSIADLVNELKNHNEFGKAFDPSGTTGSGTRPGNAGTPRTQVDASKLTPTEKIALALTRQHGVR